MIFYLIQFLSPFYPSLRAFTYFSSRSILSLITSILLSMVLYPFMIKILKSFRADQPIRTLGPESHFSKQGTPTMGGVVIIFCVVVTSLLWMDWKNIYVWIPILSLISFGMIGFFDDYIKITQKNHKGLSSRHKLLSLIFVSLIILILVYLNNKNQFGQITLPFLKDIILDTGLFYFFIGAFILVGSSNAVNLTDGLDGLVIGPVITSAIALMILSYVTGNSVISKYLYYDSVPGSGEIPIFLAAIIGSSIGFLWYNTWPAQVFMGDSGSLALGGSLASIAILIHQELLFALMGGIFVLEAISVMMQVLYYKKTQKRIFLMAPLHHHFEKKGWPEQKITIRAWIISLILSLISILTLKLR